MEKQLVKTTMSPEQRKDALDHLFGPAAPAGLVVSGSSGSKAAPSAMASSGPKASPSVQVTARDSGPSAAKKTKGWISLDKVIENTKEKQPPLSKGDTGVPRLAFSIEIPNPVGRNFHRHWFSHVRAV